MLLLTEGCVRLKVVRHYLMDRECNSRLFCIGTADSDTRRGWQVLAWFLKRSSSIPGCFIAAMPKNYIISARQSQGVYPTCLPSVAGFLQGALLLKRGKVQVHNAPQSMPQVCDRLQACTWPLPLLPPAATAASCVVPMALRNLTMHIALHDPLQIKRPASQLRTWHKRGCVVEGAQAAKLRRGGVRAAAGG